MAIHDRVSVNPMTTIAMPFAEAVELWVELGTVRIGLNAIQLENTGWDDSLARVMNAGLDVRYLNYGPSARIDDEVGWRHDQAVLHRAVDAAALVGSPCVYLCTGSPGQFLWEDAVPLLEVRLAPVIALTSVMPHLVPIAVPPLDRDRAIAILTTSADSPLLKFYSRLATCGLDTELTSEAIQGLVHQAAERFPDLGMHGVVRVLNELEANIFLQLYGGNS